MMTRPFSAVCSSAQSAARRGNTELAWRSIRPATSYKNNQGGICLATNEWERASGSRRPNVLLITADQLRSDCVGYSGRYPVQTPHLDKLAAQSAAFSHAYSHFPVCSPSRQSLLHGRRPESFGALWNFNGALPTAALPPSSYTWTKTLAQNGYQLSYLGKWGVHPDYDPTAYGFDSYVSEEHYAQFQNQHYPSVSFSNGYIGETNPIPLEHSASHWFARRAADELKELASSGKPWHMALHFSDPHLPCRPSAPFADMYHPDDIPEWEGFRDSLAGKPYIQRQQLHSWNVAAFGWEQWAPIVARYYGLISQLDDAIGQVIEALDATGEAEHTIVVFTADHGDMCGSHGMMDKHYIMYDDVVRVPLLIRWPGQIKGGTACSEFVYSMLDLPPSLMEWLALEDSDFPDWHGRSLAPLLGSLGISASPRHSPASVGGVLGQAAQDSEHSETDALPTHKGGGQPWRTEAVATYNGQQFGLYTQRMIRTQYWKYVWNPTDTDELYDMLGDPGELNNRIGDAQLTETLADLRARLYEILHAAGDGAVQNPWMRRQLLEGAKL
ncbi:hypothetical protein EBB07_15800 [Paenibacillaceae bacterium]|nr:hypothetical protein EBB07_15800 [Paenibacillaceae bacterium]